MCVMYICVYIHIYIYIHKTKLNRNDELFLSYKHKGFQTIGITVYHFKRVWSLISEVGDGSI
jgi:hypothetical protein